ncbi:MAG: TVP38/TMEM64 family protein [Rhodoblastus sp.]
MGKVAHNAAPSPAVLRQYAPLAAIGLALALFFWLRLDRYASLDYLVEFRTNFSGAIDRRFGATICLFVAVYAALVAISAPGATLLTIAGGALFGLKYGLAANVAAATLGACALFLAARSAFGATIVSRAGPRLLRLRDNFHANSIGYLLFLRLSPLFPFWLVNLAAALAGVSLRTFFWTTALGVMPATFVFTAAGAAMDQLIADALVRHAACTAAEPAASQAACKLDIPLSAVVTPQIFALLIGLSLIALVPVATRLFRTRAKNGDDMSLDGR